MIITGIILSLIAAYFTMLWHQRKKISEVAEEKWEEEDKTVYVLYGKHEIPMLGSQVAKWESMSEREKWCMLEHLKQEVKGKRLTVEKTELGTTKFVGVTKKAKDIQFRQKQREQGWKS